MPFIDFSRPFHIICIAYISYTFGTFCAIGNNILKNIWIKGKEI